jgi:hypothetical protein
VTGDAVDRIVWLNLERGTAGRSVAGFGPTQRLIACTGRRRSSWDHRMFDGTFDPVKKMAQLWEVAAGRDLRITLEAGHHETFGVPVCTG